MKREGNLFDVTMGTYDGAEVCELVGIFKVQTRRQNKKKQKMEHNMVQSTIQHKCGNKSWSLLLTTVSGKSFVH